jgi:glycosyltransferase involved in cell wall biosynthesis
MSESAPLVSIIIAALNERQYIEQSVRSALCGTLDARRVEVIVADGGSSDGTREIVARLAAEFPGSVRLIDNPRRIAPAGFNLAIAASRAPNICVHSAHGYLAADFLSLCLAKLDQTGADAVGGADHIIPSNDGLEARMVMAILSNRFGIGSSTRTRYVEGPVDTLSPAVFRRGVFERVGLFDERLARNQDNELSSRVVAGGGLIHMCPQIHSYYYSRGSLRKLLRQNFYNGLYGILTWRINPDSFQIRHAIPFFFVLFLILGGGMTILWHPLVWPFAGMLSLYGALAVLASVHAGIKFRMPLAVLFPLMFLTLHLAYGIGTLAGVFRFGLAALPPGTVEKLSPLR